MNAKLVSVNSCCEQREIVLQTLPVVVGRSCDATIQVQDRWVSRRHCEIGEVGGKLMVRDLESRHGTFVNGQPVTQAVLLPGDKLSVGTSMFVAAYDQQPAESLASMEPEACAT